MARARAEFDSQQADRSNAKKALLQRVNENMKEIDETKLPGDVAKAYAELKPMISSGNLAVEDVRRVKSQMSNAITDAVIKESDGGKMSNQTLRGFNAIDDELDRYLKVFSGSQLPPPSSGLSKGGVGRS